MKNLKNVSVEESKKIRFDIMVEVDDFCRKNNLKYFLSYGTLLGAIRHKGYIPWEFVMNLADAGYKVGPKSNPTERDATNKCLEGPEWFFYNVADRKDPDVPEIGLMADYYANTSVGYIPFSTTDIEDVDNSNHSWRKLEDGAEDGYSWDAQTKRHGTILRITAEEAERLKEAFPIA